MRIVFRLWLIGAPLCLCACGGGPAAPPEPTVSIDASATTVDAGESVTLTWTSAYATSCSASGGWSGSPGISGTQVTAALSDDTSYSLTCTGPGGTSKPATVTITVNAPPTAQLSAMPTAVAAASASTLTWSSTHASSCAAVGDWSGTLAAAGTQSTGVLMTRATFSLTCTGAGGTTPPVSATVTVYPRPAVALTATPTAVAAGASSNLTWTSSNADSCSASGGWSGALMANGSESTGPITATEVYSIVCTGPGGTSPPASATVALIPAPTAALSASPTAVAAGAICFCVRVWLACSIVLGSR